MRIAGLSLVMAALMLGGCREEAPDVPLTNEPGVYHVGAGLDGQDVTLSAGQTLRVELETIPTAGYIWQVTGQPGFLELTGEQTRPTNPEVQNQPGFTGGSHYMAFDFAVTGAGTGTLELTEGRPWELEAGEPPEGAFTLNVTVSE
ncbi:protease inhibitor I42 family protein [uncultured Hyphomonas sp.]|uniref:protease inhibitor I42 family protein n=1 Tax=uncultured Hyphomonas sp. TaxID=225298 RepID=UPI002AAC4C45|nr:protease inhibitor I42 family protein [uncultured Hyphomonas sp.]